MKNFADLRFTK